MTDDNVIQFPTHPDEDVPDHVVLARENMRRQEEIGVMFPDLGMLHARVEALKDWLFSDVLDPSGSKGLEDAFELYWQRIISGTLDRAEEEKARQKSQLLQPDGRLVLPDGTPTGSPA